MSVDDEKGVGMGGDLRYGLLVWAYRCCGDTLDARARHGCFRNPEPWGSMEDILQRRRAYRW